MSQDEWRPASLVDIEALIRYERGETLLTYRENGDRHTVQREEVVIENRRSDPVLRIKTMRYPIAKVFKVANLGEKPYSIGIRVETTDGRRVELWRRGGVKADLLPAARKMGLVPKSRGFRVPCDQAPI